MNRKKILVLMIAILVTGMGFSILGFGNVGSIGYSQYEGLSDVGSILPIQTHELHML